MSNPVPTITLGLLRKQLAGYPDDCQIDFGGLTFYRVKQRGEKEVQIEFNETVHLDEHGHVVVVNH